MTSGKTILAASMLAALAACGGGDAPARKARGPGDPPRFTVPNCFQAAQRLADTMRAQGSAMNSEDIDGIRDQVSRTCTGDAWSAVSIQCVADAQSGEEVEACVGQMTPAQQDAFAASMQR